MNKFCGKCGAEIPVGNGFCPKCGTMVSMDMGTQQAAPAASETKAGKDKEARPKNIMGICSLVSFAIAFVFSYSVSQFGLAIFIVLWIASIVFCILGMRQKDAPKGTAIAGIVLNSLAVILLIFGAAYTIGMDDGYVSGYDSGYNSGYDSGYEVPWYEKIFE